MGQTILMISKPVAPPWNDSSKNLVKDLAVTGRRYTYRVLTPRGYRLPAPGVISEPLYGGVGGFSPALLQNLRVLGRLLLPDDAALVHFFFAPNRRSSGAARLATALRRRPTVQTVCSAPASYDGAERLLFGRRVVVLSRHTRGRFIEAGIPPDRLTVIPPGIQIPSAAVDETRRRAARRAEGLPERGWIVIYPGDLQFSSAAETVARAVPLLADLELTVIFACRIKQPESRDNERRIRAWLAGAGLADRVLLRNEVPDMPRLLAACDLCLLPAESVYAKMDLPLVLLEAMALGIPLVVADRPPLTELLEVEPGIRGGADDDEVGLAVPPGDPAGLADAVRRLLTDPPRLRRAGAAARRAAVRTYGIEAVSGRHERLYAELIGG